MGTNSHRDFTLDYADSYTRSSVIVEFKDSFTRITLANPRWLRFWTANIGVAAGIALGFPLIGFGTLVYLVSQ
jgi:hypothetical protein